MACATNFDILMLDVTYKHLVLKVASRSETGELCQMANVLERSRPFAISCAFGTQRFRTICAPLPGVISDRVDLAIPTGIWLSGKRLLCPDRCFAPDLIFYPLPCWYQQECSGTSHADLHTCNTRTMVWSYLISSTVTFRPAARVVVDQTVVTLLRRRHGDEQ